MNKNTVLFIVLSILVWIVYVQFILPIFVKPQTPKPKQPITPTQVNQQTPEINKPSTTTIASSTPVEVSIDEPELEADRVISNSCITAVFTNKGASLKSLSLDKYKAPARKNILSLINLFQEGKNSLSLSTSGEDLSSVNWQITAPLNNQSITFQRKTKSNLIITKQFTLYPDKYILDYKISVTNTQNTAIETSIKFNGFSGINPEAPDHTDIKGVRGYRENESKWVVREEFDINGLANFTKDGKPKLFSKRDDIQQKDNVIWTGLVNKYFACVMVPSTTLTENVLVDYGFELLTDNICMLEEMERLKKSGDRIDPKMEETIKTWARNMSFYAQTRQITIDPNSSVAYNFTAYIGPKENKYFEQLPGKGINNLLSFGFFGFISSILMAILKLFYAIVGNYGWAIIFLTILIKILLFPITKKGQVSAYKLQQIQPKIKALQEKYKNDKQKLGVEQMKLFKEYGVNPFSGCLPILFQIPVFIGLYSALSLAIELREAPFMFWITDLSQPDKLGTLPFSVLGAKDFNLLPILMTISWLAQSLTQPKAVDPQARQQQKIFLIMPLFSLLLFYNVPSGLTLYWFIQTLLSVVEQIIIKRVYLKQ
jgi:YidC/Oxa1 family membrane protein insertase